MTDESHLKLLLRTLSHDLRGSVGATSSLAELLNNNYASQLDERATNWLDVMAKEYDGLREKLKSLSAYAQLFDYTLSLESLALEELLGICEELTRQEYLALAKNSQLKVEHQDLGHLRTDATLMTAYIKELFANSLLHATPETESESESESDDINMTTIKCQFSCIQNDSGLSLVYQDNGKALAESDISYIQQPFKTLKNSRSTIHTVGMGFSTLRRIAELLEGSLSVSLGKSAQYPGLRVELKVLHAK